MRGPYIASTLQPPTTYLSPDYHHHLLKPAAHQEQRPSFHVMPYPQFIKLTDQEIRTMISDLEVAIFEDQNYLDQLSSDLVIITAKWIDLKNPEMVNENEETAKKLLDQIGALEWNIDTQIETLDGLAWQLKDLKWELLERTENLEKATTGEDDKDEGGEGIGEEA